MVCGSTIGLEVKNAWTYAKTTWSSHEVHGMTNAENVNHGIKSSNYRSQNSLPAWTTVFNYYAYIYISILNSVFIFTTDTNTLYNF